VVTDLPAGLIKVFAAEESAGGLASLGVDFKALILQILTFVLVFVLLKKFAFDKIVKMLDERRETIDQGVELGQQMAEEKARLDEQVDIVLQKARSEADKIITAGHQDAADLLKEAEERAAKKADSLLTDARMRIDEDIKAARKSLEKETALLVAQATEAVIGERLDQSKDSKLIERALKEAGQ
jgi:F-type H+-transporting ATPase subunit b